MFLPLESGADTYHACTCLISLPKLWAFRRAKSALLAGVFFKEQTIARSDC
jgi:hypothetical protein